RSFGSAAGGPSPLVTPREQRREIGGERRMGSLRRIARWMFGTLLLAGVVAALGAVVVWRLFLTDLPPIDRLLTHRAGVATRIYAADGSLIGEMFVERRYPVTLAQVPLHVRLAFLACEDAGFYSPTGFQPRSMARAILANYSRGRIVQGGST